MGFHYLEAIANKFQYVALQEFTNMYIYLCHLALFFGLFDGLSQAI